MMHKAKRGISLYVIVIALVGLVCVEIARNSIITAVPHGNWLYEILSRAFGSIAGMAIIYKFASKRVLSMNFSMRSVLVWLPCMLIAVNNFPFVPFLSGEADIVADAWEIIMYALVCICVGTFEELAFRGCIFPLILQRRGKKVVDVFWSVVISSAIFGCIHLVNLFFAADPFATILQVGYSFLIGAMCSILLIRTGSIWYCAVLHAVYNFAGGIIPNCGVGIIWNTAEIILTAVVSVVVAVYVIYLLLTIKKEQIDNIC